MKPEPSALPWREWLPTLHASVKLGDPASESAVSRAEAALGVTFNGQLRGLLLASDGVRGPYGFWLVWPADRITSQNREHRTLRCFKGLYMPFDHLLFIGEAGNGDLFAYPIMADGNAACRGDVFRWDHETDSHVWVAGGLRRYLQGVTAGTIRA